MFFFLFKENPSSQQTYTQKVPQPSQTSCMRDNLPEFPHLDKELINAAIKEGMKKQQNSRYGYFIDIFLFNFLFIFCFRPYSARVSQLQGMSTDLITVNFCPPPLLLSLQYLNKKTVLEAEIFSFFISHLGLHTGKISLKSVTSIEHVFCCLDRPYRAMPPKN